MNKDFNISDSKMRNRLILFIVSICAFFILLEPSVETILSINSNYGVYMIPTSMHMLSISFILFLISEILKYFDINHSKFFDFLTIINMIVYILVFVFALLNNIFIANGFLIKTYISFTLISLAFLNVFFTIIILIKITYDIGKCSYNILSIIGITSLVLSFVYLLYFGGLGYLFSLPDNTTISHNGVDYIVIADVFLQERDEQNFYYYESVNPILMKKLNDGDIPHEILAQNNGYY